MNTLVEAQRTFFLSNATKSISFRIEQLQKFERVLKENERQLNDAIYADFKKSEFDNYISELSFVYLDIKETLKKLRSWSRKKRVKTNLLNFPAKSYVIPEPLGVSLVIGAWNYPYQLSLLPVVAAMGAGCTIILKPSELPTHTSAIMEKLISTHFDPRYFKVVEGGIPETTELLAQKFDKIFFTGSATVGKIIYQAAAKHLTPVTLELGGKSPAFITKSCDLNQTVKRLMWGKFFNAGQTCVAPDYIYVDASIQEKFIELCKEEITRSHYSVENGNYTQIINDRNVERLQAMIDPQKTVFGGNVDRESRIIQPTLLTNITWEDSIMEEEIFGPILPILSYHSLDDAIREVKKRPAPLACYVFTKDRSHQDKILNEVSFGGGAINEAIMHISNHFLGFGGVGSSGIGAYHGKEGFKAFSHYKSILDKPNWLEFSLKYYPHTDRKLRWIKRIIGQRSFIK